MAFGEDLKAQAEASDKKTSAEPTFSDIGKSLNSQFGQGSGAQDVGKAIKDNTPSPQGIVQGAKDAGKKLNKAADLGNVFDDVLGKVWPLLHFSYTESNAHKIITIMYLH